MSENVFDIVQIGLQSGTFAAPGSAAAATTLYPVESPVPFDLDRGSSYPKQDRGRNVRNTAGVGYHGVRGSSATLPAQVRFEDIQTILELIYAGAITPSGSNPYTWVYAFEAVAPTLVPATVQGGNTDASQAQMRMRSCLVDSLTLGFPAITAPGASPWALSASIVGLDREISALTPSLGVRGAGVLETVQGHLTRLYEGTTGTAYASLSELAGTLKMYSLTANRSLARRAYGGSDDLATGFGFSDMSNASVEATVAVSSGSKSDFHDIWNAASPAALGERRWRVKAIGTGSKVFTIDQRIGIMAVPIDENDGERLFRVTGELADDSTLSASHTVTVVNTVAS